MTQGIILFRYSHNLQSPALFIQFWSQVYENIDDVVLYDNDESFNSINFSHPIEDIGYIMVVKSY